MARSNLDSFVSDGRITPHGFTHHASRPMSTDSASPAPIRSVLETSLYARDLDAAAHFYGTVLGLEEVSRKEGRHVFFRCGRQMVLVFNPAVTSESGGTLPPHGAQGPGHVAFAVGEANLDVWRERLDAHGVPIDDAVSWGEAGRSLYVRDPAGNSVELAPPSLWFDDA
jgi:catechol 2,3-dioxygenase-like lactoylglutathione lyase family enzyme